MTWFADFFREVWASALSQRVTSVVSIAIVAGMCVSVVLTTGRTVGLEQSVLATIDSTGTRSILVRAEPDAGLDTEILERISGVEGIEWAGAFSPALDVGNASLQGGNVVPARQGYSVSFEYLGLHRISVSTESHAYVSSMAQTRLGLSAPSGGLIQKDGGVQYSVVGSLRVPDYLAFLEPLVLAPQTMQTIDEPRAVGLLIVIAEKAELVPSLAKTVASLLGVQDVTKVSLETSDQLVALNSSIEAQLGAFGRSLVLVIALLTAASVSALFCALMMLRRKDFGRRRALGATKSLVMALLMAQLGLLSIVGATVGSLLSLLSLAILGDPQPPITFYAGVSILAVTAGLAAAVVPAVVASRRDPLRELRVP